MDYRYKGNTLTAFLCGGVGGVTKYYNNVNVKFIESSVIPHLDYHLIIQSGIVAFVCGAFGVVGKFMITAALKKIGWKDV